MPFVCPKLLIITCFDKMSMVSWLRPSVRVYDSAEAGDLTTKRLLFKIRVDAAS